VWNVAQKCVIFLWLSQKWKRGLLMSRSSAKLKA
jgi:hypothetical protein